MAVDLIPLPPADAIRALERRGRALHPSFSWQDAWEEEHAAMFTVARSAGFDVLKDIHDALEKALKEGRTFRDFSKELTPVLQDKGWWGKKLVEDPATGVPVPAQLGSPRRLETIFNTNMRVSYAAGHWSSFERNKALRPFLRYVHIDPNLLNPNSRAHHARQHNVVLPVDHPYWNTWATPNGWGCRCTLQSLSQRDVDRLQRSGEKLQFEPPEDTFRSFVNRRTGEISRVPDGIDAGWAYNPGKAGHRASALMDRLADAPPELATGYGGDKLARAIDPEFTDWIGRISRGERVDRAVQVAGVLDKHVLDELGKRGIQPQSSAITVSERAVRHALRDVKKRRGAAAPADILARMPDIFAAPKAILRDTRDGKLLYVFDLPGESGRAGKLVVEVDFVQKIREQGSKAQRVSTNAFRTAGILTRKALKNSVYEVISGAL
ncbi:phage head morphogenesis protein [Aliihoeflea sp. PC F10.4]